MSAIVDGETISEEVLVADGSRRPVSEGGCSGWTRYLISEDQRRLYRQSKTTCDDNGEISLSGASLIVSGGRWVEIDVKQVDGVRELLVRHYQIVDADTFPESDTIRAAAHIARAAAAVPLSVEDVIEALEYLDPAVVEAMLVESKSRFPMASRLLMQLVDAGAPAQIIDLMMAQSYPELFAVKEEPVIVDPVINHRYWAPWYDCFGHGYHREHAHPDSTPGVGGRAVKSRGYTTVQPIADLPSGRVRRRESGSGDSSGGTSGGASSGSGGGTGSSVSGSGYDRGASPSIGRAMRR
jgi:uncharacterized membrane protein YgcG